MKKKIVVIILLAGIVCAGSLLLLESRRVKPVSLPTEAVSVEEKEEEVKDLSSSKSSDEVSGEVSAPDIPEEVSYASYEEACKAAGVPESLPDTAGDLTMDAFLAVPGEYAEVHYLAEGKDGLFVREGKASYCGAETLGSSYVSTQTDPESGYELQIACSDDGKPVSCSVFADQVSYRITSGVSGNVAEQESFKTVLTSILSNQDNQ